jgi:hypothetical protein
LTNSLVSTSRYQRKACEQPLLLCLSPFNLSKASWIMGGVPLVPSFVGWGLEVFETFMETGLPPMVLPPLG